MLIKQKHGWEISENEVTDEKYVLNRRKAILLGGATLLGATGGLDLASNGGLIKPAHAASAQLASLLPAPRESTYPIDRPITDSDLVTRYNNYYEFGLSKNIVNAAQALETEPWMIKIDGAVEKEFEIEFDDLLKKVPVVERVYRHRCVERWCFAAPWTGMPLSKVIEFAKPLGSAKYVNFDTINLASPFARLFSSSWPYKEGLTMEEANNDLALLGVGAYGRPLEKQMGAPIRLVTPWKFGFKSIKSIVRINFSEEKRNSYWETEGGGEYGFWANVNPAVSHRRWSQAMEQILGTSEMRPTQIYNGYGEWVAGMYPRNASPEYFF